MKTLIVSYVLVIFPALVACERERLPSLMDTHLHGQMTTGSTEKASPRSNWP